MYIIYVQNYANFVRRGREFRCLRAHRSWSKGVKLMKNNIRKLAVLAIVAMLLTLVPLASIAETKMVVTGNFVNLRDKASGGASIGQYNKGTIVTYLGAGNGYMYHVEINGKKGYMSKDYLKPYSSSSTTAKPTETKKDTATGKTTTTKTTTAKTTNANGAVARNNDTVRGTVSKQINVRTQANQSSKIVGTLKTRTTVSVLSRKNNYVYITTSKISGYVPANAVTLSNTKAQTAQVKKAKDGSYKIYVGSTGTGKVVATVKNNSKITVLHQGSNWSYVKVGNVYGYISKNSYTINK